MLKRFFLNLASSFVGTWLALGLFGAVVMLVIFALIGKFSASETENVSRHSILKISLKGAIEEREGKPDMSLTRIVNGEIEQAQALDVLVKAIEDAENNKNIDLIYLECGGVSAGLATLNSLRDALAQFKTNSKKKVIAYADLMTQADYYVASVADSVFVNPQGELSLTGIYGGIQYMKNLFDKIGVEFQVVKVGTFKSAVEPYISETMSEPARAQLDTLYGHLWNEITAAVQKDRKVTAATINNLVNDTIITLSDLNISVNAKLIDGTLYERQVKERLAKLTDKEPDELNFVSPSTLVGPSILYQNPGSKKQIGVLYCIGEISETSKEGINCYVLVPEILKMAEDENVKGLVLRVNSPGGSVFGSEQIWEAVQYFKSKNKPVAVSMGDYAASGGYYISCNSDRIFANAMTITGSIGIFGLFPNVAGLTKMLGVSTQTVSTNPNGMILLPLEPLNETQLAAAQSMVDRGYEQFCKRVADGRGLTVAQVKQIAEGRVWSAAKAKEIGLVDEIGGLQDAVKWVAAKANIVDDYNLCGYPQAENSIWQYLPSSAQAEVINAFVKEKYGEDLPEAALLYIQSILLQKPLQARMQPVEASL